MVTSTGEKNPPKRIGLSASCLAEVLELAGVIHPAQSVERQIVAKSVLARKCCLHQSGVALACCCGASEPEYVDATGKLGIGLDCRETNLPCSHLESADAIGLQLRCSLRRRFRRLCRSRWRRWLRRGGDLSFGHAGRRTRWLRRVRPRMICRCGPLVQRLEVFRIHDAAARTFVLRGVIGWSAYVAALWAGGTHCLCGK